MPPDEAERNIWEMHLDFARLPRAEVHDDLDLLWFTLPSPNSWLNGASRTQLGVDAVESRISEVVDKIHQRGRNVLWHVTPSCRPADLAQRLERRGFEGDVSTAMVADLLSLRVGAHPLDLEVVHASTPHDVLDWVNTFDVALLDMPPRATEHPWLQPFTHLALGELAPYRLFIGRVDGTSVACSLAFIGGGAVGLYGVGTRPSHRGRGYGSAVTAAAMAWGRERNERLAILHATEMGKSVYAALGFRAVWEKTQWVLPAPGAP